MFTDIAVSGESKIIRGFSTMSSVCAPNLRVVQGSTVVNNDQ